MASRRPRACIGDAVTRTRCGAKACKFVRRRAKWHAERPRKRNGDGRRCQVFGDCHSGWGGRARPGEERCGAVNHRANWRRSRARLQAVFRLEPWRAKGLCCGGQGVKVFGVKSSLGSSRGLPSAPLIPINSRMKKSTNRYVQRISSKAAAKPASKSLVAVRKAAQKPVHATRAAIRQAVRSVAKESHYVDA